MSRGRQYFAVVVLFVGVAISSALFFILRAQEDKAESLDFNFRANTRISDIQDAIEDNLDILRALGSFYFSSQEVEREEFRTFTKGFIDLHPDIEALIWMPRVLDSEIKNYQEIAAKDGYPDFKIKERNSSGSIIDATSRSEYFPVYYVEPFEENKIIFGVDFSNDVAHFRAMEKAASSGDLSATGGIKLIRDSSKLGCKVFFPVYRKDASLVTPEERLNNLFGFLAILFDFEDMLSYKLQGRPRISIDTYLYDESIFGEEYLLYYHSARTRTVKPLPVSENDTKAAAGLFLIQDLRFGNNTWRMLCRPAPKFFKEHKRLYSWSVFIIGLILTGTLLYNLFLILNRAARVEALVKERTTELNKASLELGRINKRLEFILGATKTGIDIIDSDYNMVYIDPEWQKVYGEYKGRKCYEYFMGAKEKCASCNLEKVFSTKQLMVSEEVLMKENNRPVQVISMPFQNEEGNWLVAEVNVDITERKKIESDLKNSKDYIELLFKLIPSAIFTVDTNRRVKAWNKKAFEITGYTADEVVGKECRIFAEFPCKDKCGLYSDDVIKPVVAKECTIRTKDGRLRTIEKNVDVLKDEKGNVVGGIESFEDITERKNIEEDLKESESKFRMIYESSYDAIMLLNEKGFFDCNKRTLELFGFNTVEEFREIQPSDVSPQVQPDGRDSYTSSMEHIQAAFQKGTEHFEWMHSRKDGTNFVADVLLSAFQYRGKTVLQAVVRDITERKKAEKIIADASREWSLTFDSMADGVSIHGSNYEILNVNSTLCKLLGKTKEELIGKKCYQIFHGKNNPLNDCPLEKSKTTRQKEYAEVFEPTLDKWLAVSVSPIFDENGNIIRLVHLLRDITERKRIEKAKDEFVSMVSHELRTPLTAINESIKIVLDGSAGSVNEEQKDFLDTAKNNVERLARLINSVLDFQRLQSGRVEFKIEETDINLVVKDVASSMLPLVKNKGLEFNINLGDNIPKVKMDRDKITEVLTNLVNNAIKFTDKGSISIVTERKHDNAISVCVRDTGIGIKKEDLDKLFTSFSQVAPREYKKTGSSGLGLAISKEIILKHGGKIWVESELGRGSAFIFVFPIVERRIA